MKCAVCSQPARGFHFGAFTCEGCKSFFGRTAQRGSQQPLTCRFDGKCDVLGTNRRTCKACRYQACVSAGMDIANSRFGRRSKYFKVSMAVASQGLSPMVPAVPVAPIQPPINMNLLLLAIFYNNLNLPIFPDSSLKLPDFKNFSVEAGNEQK